MKRYISNILMLLIVMLIISVNKTALSQEDSVFYNSSWLRQNLNPQSRPNTLYFKAGKQIAGATIFEDHKADFGLSNDYQMVQYKTETDQIGFTHYRFQQTYKGVNIEGAQFFVHEKNGSTVTANGIMLNSVNINVVPAISASSALQYAANGDTSAKLLHPVELVITRSSDNLGLVSENLTLAYKVEVVFKDATRFAVYIDAQTGNVIKKTSLTFNCSIGVCQTLYNGLQSINTNERGIPHNDFQLIDFCRGVGIHTYLNCDPETFFDVIASLTSCPEPTDDDNQWSSQSELGAISAHWATGITWDYYLNVHGRSGTNNDDGGIDINASTTNSLKLNSGFSKQGGIHNHDLLVFGAGDGGVNSTNFATLDVVAHEFTHGVTAYTAALGHSGENGALNESFSDIFGEMVEFYQTGSCDYIMGEQHAIDPTLKRSLRNPKEFPSSNGAAGLPDTYHRTYWDFGSDDNGGVHINCSVQNHWFFSIGRRKRWDKNK